MTGARTTIYLPRELLTQARLVRLNISHIAQHAITAALAEPKSSKYERRLAQVRSEADKNRLDH